MDAFFCCCETVSSYRRVEQAGPDPVGELISFCRRRSFVLADKDSKRDGDGLHAAKRPNGEKVRWMEEAY
jgi:hypothetical protein